MGRRPPRSTRTDPRVPFTTLFGSKGPSQEVPVLWEYRRKDLPVRVIARHDLWRKVEDPDGAQGWMAARLLSRTRTAIVTGGVRSMRKTASPDAAIVYRAEPGVVGRISDCKPS